MISSSHQEKVLPSSCVSASTLFHHNWIPLEIFFSSSCKTHITPSRDEGDSQEDKIAIRFISRLTQTQTLFTWFSSEIETHLCMISLFSVWKRMPWVTRSTTTPSTFIILLISPSHFLGRKSKARKWLQARKIWRITHSRYLVDTLSTLTLITPHLTVSESLGQKTLRSLTRLERHDHQKVMTWVSLPHTFLAKTRKNSFLLSR